MSLTAHTIEQLASDIGFFRFGKMKDGDYLVTNEVGKYAYLTPSEFDLFITGKLEGDKKAELTEKLFYKTAEYEEKMVALYNHKNDFLAYGPSLHMVVTTLRCTHKCKYCHAAVAPMTAKELDMSEETARKVVDTIFYTSAPGVMIEFQGGESLVNWDIVKFITEYGRIKAQALQKSLVFALVTNLSLMDEEKLTWLLDHGVDICTSLDGDEEIHNAQRIWKDGNSFQNVKHWIGRIVEEKKKRGMGDNVSMGALTTWTKSSIKEYKKVIDVFVDLGLRTIGFRWLNPYGFAAADRENLEFSVEEFREFYRGGMDYLLELNKKGVYLSEMISRVYLQMILLGTDCRFVDVRSPSGIALGGVAYNYDGKVYASDEARMLGRMGIDEFLMTPMLETGEETYKAMANSDITKVATQASTLDGLPGYNDHVYKPYMAANPIFAFTENDTVYSNFSKDEKNQMQMIMLDYLFEKLRDPENEKVFRSWLQ